MLKRLLLALLFVPFAAQGATVTFIACTSDTTATPNATAAFTPTAGRVGIVTSTMSGSVETAPTATSSVGGQTYSLANDGVLSAIATFPTTPAHSVYVFVADQVYTAVSQTVSIDGTDGGTGTNTCVYEVDISRVGNDAILQVSSPDNDNGSAATPTTVFSASALTGNPTLMAVIVTHAGTGIDITEPSSFTDTTATIYHATPDHATEVFTRNSGHTSTTITAGGTYGGDGAAISIEIDASAAGTPLTFTAGPTRAAAANGHTIGGTLTGSGFGALVAYAVGVSPGDGAPTCTQIKAGQNDGSTAALLAGSETWTTAVANDFVISSATSIARMDVHVCGSDGTNNTSVTTFSDADRSPRSGFALIAHTSVATTGICDRDSYFDPDCAIGDVWEYEDDSNESADCNVSFEADGDFVLTPVAAGDCDGKRTFNISYEDVSSATTGLFAAPATGNFTTDDLVCNGNSAPTWSLDPADEFRMNVEDAVAATLSLGSISDDPDGDSGTYAVTAGTLPTGLSLNTSTGDITGTPTTENEVGAAVTFSRTDECGDPATAQITFYTVNTWTVPNCVGNTASECADEIVTAAPWRELDVGLSVGSLSCVAGVAGLVLSQAPAASAEAGPTDSIVVTLSQACVSGKRRLGFGIGLGVS